MTVQPNLKTSVESYFKELIKKIESFLFLSQNTLQLGIFRFVLCAALFYIALWRQVSISLFGAAAIIPRDQALSVFGDFYKPPFAWFFWPDHWASVMHILVILILGLATLGLTNRFFLLLAWVIQQGLMNRNSAFLFGGDTVGNLFLFYLAWTECTQRFSLKPLLFEKTARYFKKQKDTPIKVIAQNSALQSLKTDFKSDLSSIFFRLVQFQICIVYAYTGFEKLKGASWWDGTALWTVLANPQFASFDLKFLSAIPWIFPVLTFLTIIFEVYFPVMILHQRFKPYWLGAGVCFHLMIGLLLGLMPFSIIMLSTYILFIETSTIEAFIIKFKKISN